MINFNDNKVVVGYIKNLLHSFNLPVAAVYENDQKCYVGGLYLKDGAVQQYLGDGKFENLFTYIYDRSYPNYTKRLRLSSIIYDSYTHEYLGEYLRFMRDYNKLDLMSMYNCFSNNIISDPSFYVKVGTTVFEVNDAYKIYMVPVKFGKKYTIAIDCPLGLDVFCGFYSKKYFADDDTSANLPLASLKHFSGPQFSNPVIYDKLVNIDPVTYKAHYSDERYLKLFLKVPTNCNSSIVVLEGEYQNTNDRSFGFTLDKTSTTRPAETDPFNVVANTSVINFEEKIEGDIWSIIPEPGKVKMISSLQLLKINSGVSHPFADRLLEYLTENAITPLTDTNPHSAESIPDNIKRMQKLLVERYNTRIPLVGGGELRKAGIPSYKHYGKWEDKYKAVFYDVAKENNLFVNQSDILGYVDKDVEKVVGKDPDIYGEDGE